MRSSEVWHEGRVTSARHRGLRVVHTDSQFYHVSQRGESGERDRNPVESKAREKMSADLAGRQFLRAQVRKLRNRRVSSVQGSDRKAGDTDFLADAVLCSLSFTLQTRVSAFYVFPLVPGDVGHLECVAGSTP